MDGKSRNTTHEMYDRMSFYVILFRNIQRWHYGMSAVKIIVTINKNHLFTIKQNCQIYFKHKVAAVDDAKKYMKHHLKILVKNERIEMKSKRTRRRSTRVIERLFIVNRSWHREQFGNSIGKKLNFNLLLTEDYTVCYDNTYTVGNPIAWGNHIDFAVISYGNRARWPFRTFYVSFGDLRIDLK